MGRRNSVPGPLALMLLLGVLAVKLLLSASSLLIEGKPSHPLFSVPEVMAEDKKQATRTAKQDPPPKTKEDTEVAKPVEQATAPAPAKTASSLDQKEAELARKEQSLQEKEHQLAQMKQDIEKKLQELIAIQKEIQASREEKAQAADAKVRSLAQIYGSMKPKEAAKLLENMEENLVVTIIASMKASEAASVLSAMDNKKAAKISEALTKP